MTNAYVASELVAYWKQYCAKPDQAIYSAKLLKLWRENAKAGGSHAIAYGIAVKQIEAMH